MFGHNDGFPHGLEFGKGRTQASHRRHVEGGRGLVQNKDIGVRSVYRGKDHHLTLASGKLLHLPMQQFFDSEHPNAFVYAPHNLFSRESLVLTAERKLGLNFRVYELTAWVLEYRADRYRQISRCPFSDGLFGDGDASLQDPLVDQRDQAVYGSGQGCLPAAGFAREHYAFAWTDGQVDVFQHLRFLFVIAE